LPDGGCGKAAEAAAVADLGLIAVPLQGVDAADLGIGLSVLLRIKHEVVDVRGRPSNNLSAFTGNHDA
jgi:hypothetical protein